MLLDCNSPSTAQPFAQQGRGASMRGYPTQHAVKAYVSYCQLSKGNGPLWLRFQDATLNEFMRFALSKGARWVEALEPWHLTEYLRWRQDEHGEMTSSLTRRAVTIRAMARWAEDEGRVKASPLARARMPKQVRLQRELPSHANILALIKGMEYQDVREAAELLLLTGLRRTELLALRWCDLKTNDGVAFVRSTNLYTPKSRRARAVPLPARAVEILKDRKERHPAYTGPFLHQGKAMPHKDTLSKVFRKAADAAGLPGMRLHDLRHAFGTHAINELKADIVTVQECMGHSEITTTRGYIHANSDSAVTLKNLMDAVSMPAK